MKLEANSEQLVAARQDFASIAIGVPTRTPEIATS
jgi:hypothetical protein